jgi:hypothetical protein
MKDSSFWKAAIAPNNSLNASGGSAVFKTAGGQVNPKWIDAFSEFPYKTYGVHAEVEATCTIMATKREAEAILNSRVPGAYQFTQSR